MSVLGARPVAGRALVLVVAVLLLGTGAVVQAPAAEAKPRHRVTIQTDPTVLTKGRIVVSGKVKPAGGRHRVRLQERKKGKWRTVRSDRTNERAKYRFRIKSGAKDRRRVFRVKAAADRDHRAGTSKRAVVHVTSLSRGGVAFPRKFKGKRITLRKAEPGLTRYGLPYEAYADGEYVMAYLTPSVPAFERTDYEGGWGFIGENSSCSTEAGWGYYRTRAKTADRMVRLGNKKLRYRSYEYRCNLTQQGSAGGTSASDPGWRCGSLLCQEHLHHLRVWTGGGYEFWVRDEHRASSAATTKFRRALIRHARMR